MTDVDRLRRAADLLEYARAQRIVPCADGGDCFDGFLGGTEHRTVGPHRAWCHQDRTWCYPADPCDCCGGSATERDTATAALLRAVADGDFPYYEEAKAVRDIRAKAAALADTILGDKP